jgi:Virulence factor membrane-bound polymerase, C-terminal/O-Antigen ligase/Protein glycosylation ligase
MTQGLNRPFNQFWLNIWAIALSMGWLLPNHYAPWIAFHFDAWIAYGLLIAGFVVALRSSKALALYPPTLACLLILPIPLIQHAFGLLPFSGQAWIGTAFLLGFFVAVCTGGHWDAVKRNQGLDGLFLAIGIASIVSVGLQLFQWLGLSFEATDLWIMSSTGRRPFANFIQPNQLGTFLLWGVLAIAWGAVRGHIGHRVAIFAASYLLFGVALTGSRTALVAIIGLLLAVLVWRKLWSRKVVVQTAVGLAIFYFICAFSLPFISEGLQLDAAVGMVTRPGAGIRLTAYQLFIDATLQHPVFGYGWGQTSVAQLAVAEHHPRLSSMFLQAHNVFLDLILWCGLPLGIAISVGLIWWFVAMAKRVASPENVILLMFVGVVGWHAMLELPLHYAYMLLPTGLVMGALTARLNAPLAIQTHRRYFVGLLLLAGALLGAITRDYLQIEQNFQALRFERARIGAVPTEKPPAAWLLNHMDEFVNLGRTPAKAGMTPQELDWMQRAAYAQPSLGNLFTLLTALALNQHTQAAQLLATKLSRITTPEEYQQMVNIWQAQSQSEPLLEAVRWPEYLNDGRP